MWSKVLGWGASSCWKHTYRSCDCESYFQTKPKYLNTKYYTCSVFRAQSFLALFPFLSMDSLALNFSLSLSMWIIMFYYQIFRAKKDQQALIFVWLVMVSWFCVRSGKTNKAWWHRVRNYSWMKSEKSVITSKWEASEINSQTKSCCGDTVCVLG